MPALTHQDARLIGPFHGRYSVDRVLFRRSECGGVYIDLVRASQRRVAPSFVEASRQGDWRGLLEFGTVR